MSSLAERLSGQDGGIDLDLQEVWSEAMEEYEHITGISLQIKDGRQGFDAVAKDIDDKLRSSKSGNRAKIQQVMNGVMKALKQFGGIVAQAASVAFGPSAQCWNAISFIISAAQKYQEILDGFATLMEYSVAFLERLNIDLEAKIKNGMPFDVRLRRPTYKVIAHFLRVLANAHSMATSKRYKIKTVFKIVMFNDDAGVSVNLTQMEKLVRDLTDTKVSVILQDVQGLAKYIRDSEESINKNQGEIMASMERTETMVSQMKLEQDRAISEEKIKKDLEKIRTSLHLDDGEPWSKAQTEIGRHRLPGTGEWLLQDPIFSSWSNINVNGVVIFTLLGKQGFGKSYITSSVIDSLVQRYPTASSGARRATLAYFYFQKNSKEETVEKCLSSIIYQLAKSDRSYAKGVAEACDRAGSLSNADEIWNRLVVDLKNLMQGTYYIVVDGFSKGDGDERVDKAIQSMVQMALNADEQRSIRIFVAGRPSDLALPAFDEPGIAALDLGSTRETRTFGLHRSRTRLLDDDWDVRDLQSTPLRNEDDLVLFTKNRIDTMSKERPYLATTLGDPELNAAITLAKGVKGDYTNLQAKLDQIKDADGEIEIRDIVNRASEDLAQTLRRDVDNLNQNLNPDELLELNQLLLWVTGTFGASIDIKFLQAALGNKSLWLDKHIPEKFGKILRLDDQDLVTLRAHQLPEVLETSEPPREEDDSQPVAAIPSVALQNNEIEIVEQVVKQFLGDKIYEKFGFKDFFLSKAGQRIVRIRIPNNNVVHTTILRTILEALCQNQDDAFYKAFRKYAAYWFGEHMGNIDLLEADRKELRAIGNMLSTILYEKAAIDAWWHNDTVFLDVLRDDWLYKAQYPAKLMEWLKHPLVAAGFSSNDEKHAWIRAAIATTEGDNTVMSRVAQILADRWFIASRESRYNFSCSYGLMAKVWQYDFEEDTVPDVSQIERFAAWARQHTSQDISESHWQTRVAAAFIVFDHNEAVLEKLKTIEVNGDPPWNLLLLQAKAHKALEHHQEALECLHKIKHLKDRIGDTDHEYSCAYWDAVILMEGQAHKAMQDWDAAASCFKDLLNHDFGEESDFGAKDQAAEELFDMWKKNKAYNETIEFLFTVREAPDESQKSETWMSRLPTLEDFHLCVLSAALSTGHHERICAMYKEAIDGMNVEEQPRTVRLLKYYYALVLFHSSPPGDLRKQALDLLEHLIATSGDDGDTYWPAWISARKLFIYLLDEVKHHGVAPMSETSQQFATKLEQLSKLSLPVLRDLRDCDYDPRLAVARFRVLANDKEGARDVLQDRVRGIFDAWPEADEEQNIIARYSSLAHTLSVLNEDVNAVAAWQLLQPVYPETATKQATEESAANGVQKEPEQPVEAPMEATSGPVQTNGHPVEPLTEDDVQQATATESEDSLEDLPSWVSYSCDGECNTRWTAMGDLYACRDCLDVQLCPDCYSKLLVGDIHPLICNKTHDFLYLPPFDRKAWIEMDPKTMRVGDEIVERQAWLHGLREEWGMHQEHIDDFKLTFAQQVNAAKLLTRMRRRVLDKRSEANTQAAP